MRKPLEDIAQHISDVFTKEKTINRFKFSDKYTQLFDDYVYELTISNTPFSLHHIAKSLEKPLFIFNEKHDELIVISPIFALLFCVDENTKYDDIKCKDWFSREFWEKKLPNAAAEEPKLKYETIHGDIPEFMACLKTKNDELAINVLRCKHQINLDGGASYLVNDMPPMFTLDHSDPIHLVRFLMSHQQDR